MRVDVSEEVRPVHVPPNCVYPGRLHCLVRKLVAEVVGYYTPARRFVKSRERDSTVAHSTLNIVVHYRRKLHSWGKRILILSTAFMLVATALFICGA